MSLGDAAAERDHRRDLRPAEIAIAEGMAGVHHLDADRQRVDVALAAPRAAAGVPGAIGLPHHLGDPPVLVHEVVGRHFADRVAEPGFGRLAGLHAGVVKDDQLRPDRLATHAEIGRNAHLGTGMVGGEACHAALRPFSISS